MFVGTTSHTVAAECSNKLFSVTIDSKLTVGDVIDNLAETCGMTVVLKDEAAKMRMS
jgi:general secretion pathway protein D